MNFEITNSWNTDISQLEHISRWNPEINLRFHTHLGGGGQVKVDLSYAHCESLQLLPSGLVSVRPLFKQVLFDALM